MRPSELNMITLGFLHLFPVSFMLLLVVCNYIRGLYVPIFRVYFFAFKACAGLGYRANMYNIVSTIC